MSEHATPRTVEEEAWLAEHDAQVAARALREAAEVVHATEWAYTGLDDWLSARADRIERQEKDR